MSQTLRTYLYALIHPAEVSFDVPGIDNAPVRVIKRADDDDIAAVASTVPADMFDPATLETRLADLKWLEAVALAHDGVVTEAAAGATVIPLRLGTTADDDDSVQGLLADLAPAAKREFDRLRSRQEYGVQVFGTPRNRSAQPSRTDQPESGLSFLQRRRAELDDDAALRSAEAEEADAVVAALRAEAVDCHRNPPREGPTGPGSRPMLANAVFLVDQERVEPFRALVEDLAASLGSGRVALTGPWAPYSFAELTL